MRHLDRDSIDFGHGGIAGTFAHLLVPTLLGMLFSVLFCLTDGIFVGHGIGSDALAAINLVMPVFTLFTGIGMMFAMGASVVAAIHLSHDNVKAARIIVTQAFIAVITLGLVLGALLYAFPSGFLSWLGSSEALMPLCRDYYLWLLPVCLFVPIQMVAQFVIRLDGDPEYAGMVEIVPACINIFLDWLFIFPCGWGLKGAAFATCIGSGTGVLMGAWYMFFRRRTLGLYRLKNTMTSLVLTLRNCGYMMRVGFSGFLSEFSMSVLMLVGNYQFIRRLGDDGVAAFSVACYLMPVIFMVYGAISQAAQPIVSYNFGAGNQERVRKTFRLALWCSIAFGALMTLLMAPFAGRVIAVFLNADSEAYRICVEGFPLYTLGFVFMAVAVTVTGYLQSVERSLYATVLTVLRGMLLPLLTFLILPSFLGDAGLWIAVPVSEAVTVAVIVIHSLSGR